MLRSALLFAVLVARCYTLNLAFKDCGSRDATISAVVADNCAHEPCSVQRGSVYTGYVNFTANIDAAEAHTILHGGLGLLSLPWPVEPADACQGSLPCPLKAGQTYTYKINMNCPSIAPQARITAKWELKDENARDIICFIIPLVIH